MACRTLAVIVLVVCCALAGCSNGKASGGSSSSTTTIGGTRVTMPRAFVATRVARVINPIRNVLANERTFCGSATIEQLHPAAALKCKQSLALLAKDARGVLDLVEALRPPNDLEALVANLSDAAEPIVVLFRTYPARACLPSPASGAPDAARCATAGREFASLIGQFNAALTAWDPYVVGSATG